MRRLHQLTAEINPVSLAIAGKLVEHVGQLGVGILAEVIQQVRDGIVESTISSAGGIAQHYPLVGVFDIPFAFPNIAVANRVIDQRSEFGMKFSADLDRDHPSLKPNVKRRVKCHVRMQKL